MDCYVNNDGTVVYAKQWFGDNPPKGFKLANSEKAEKQMTERINKLNNFDIKQYLTNNNKTITID